VDENQKKKKLFEIIRTEKYFAPPMVVFVGSKLGAEMLANTVATVCVLFVLFFSFLFFSFLSVEANSLFNRFVQFKPLLSMEI